MRFARFSSTCHNAKFLVDYPAKYDRKANVKKDGTLRSYPKPNETRLVLYACQEIAPGDEVILLCGAVPNGEL